jgi:hypothetical protein
MSHINTLDKPLALDPGSTRARALSNRIRREFARFFEVIRPSELEEPNFI